MKTRNELRPFASNCLVLVSLLLGCAIAPAADLTLKVVDKPPPRELAAAIAGTLAPQAVQLLAGDTPALEFWFSAAVPVQARPASPGKALDAVKQCTLLGAVAVPKARRDYRDDELAEGVYTVRLGLQPQDGDHLGTAEFTWFAVLVPAKYDAKPEGITDYKPLVKASGKDTSGGHPVILSLRPASSAEGEFPRLNEPAPDHKSVVLKLPAKVAGSGEKTDLVFELVYEGKAKK
jgi:hypothetical protein